MQQKFAEIESAAQAGATGINGFKEPTEAQKASGNYRKGRVVYNGMTLVFENPRGSIRSGVDKGGTAWSCLLAAHYGYIRMVGAPVGADGDHLDFFMGPHPESDQVFVINQIDPATRRFDEHKLVFGCASKDEAESIYRRSYAPGWAGLQNIIPATVEQIKWWIKHGNHKVPLTANALPFDGKNEMNFDAVQEIFNIRKTDTAGEMFDAVDPSWIMDQSEGELALDALVVQFSKMERKAQQLMTMMGNAANAVKPVAMQVTKPFKQRGTTNVAAIYELSDGQTVTIFFHNPDSTPNKITPQDELVSWKWLLNKKDVTIIVAPEQGRDLNPREVGRRVIKLAEKNSDRFQSANKARAERMQATEAMKSAVAAKEAELADLDTQVADLTAKVEAKRAADKAKPVSNPDRIDYEGPGAGTPTKSDDAFNRRYRWMQKKLSELGLSQVGPDGYEIKIEDEGRVLYAIKRSAAQPSPQIDLAPPLHVFKNEETGMEGLVVNGVDGKFNAVLRDADSGEYVPTAFVGYSSIEAAIEKAKEIAGIKEGRQASEQKQSNPAADLKALSPFLSGSQRKAIQSAMKGEEGQFFADKVSEMVALIAGMPKTYDQDGMGDKAVAYLHYFKGGMDWYITEKDAEGEGTMQAFGLADLGQGGELGYISIAELVSNGVELDLHFEPKTVAEIQGKKVAPENVSNTELIEQDIAKKDHVEKAAQELGGTLSDWVQSAAKEWQYAKFTKGEKELSIGASTGGVVSVNGKPHDADGQLILSYRQTLAVMRAAIGESESNDDTFLPEGWTESAPGRMATNTDPVSGGIIDQNSEGWFVIPENDAIKKIEGLPTRKAAFEALAAAVAAVSEQAFNAESAIAEMESIGSYKGIESAASNLTQEQRNEIGAKLGYEGEPAAFVIANLVLKKMSDYYVTPEGYAKVMSDEALQIANQDQLDSFFGSRIVDVRNALRSLDWFGTDQTFSKGDYRFSYDLATVGAGKNVTGVRYEVYDTNNAIVKSIQDDLTKTPEQIAAEIDAAAGDGEKNELESFNYKGYTIRDSGAGMWFVKKDGETFEYTSPSKDIAIQSIDEAYAKWEADTAEFKKSQEDDAELTEAKSFLQTVIDGTADMWDTTIADKLADMYQKYEGTELAGTVEQAINAYSTFALNA